MGLDMYLTARIHLASDAGVEVSGVDATQGLEVAAVEYDLGYWRKANAIHGWFVNQVQGGVDDCASYDVSIYQLRSLRDACNKALEEINPEGLPPTSGFFFGSTDVDDYYWDDLRMTVDICNKAEALMNGTTHQRRWWRFTYQSSW